MSYLVLGHFLFVLWAFSAILILTDLSRGRYMYLPLKEERERERERQSHEIFLRFWDCSPSIPVYKFEASMVTLSSRADLRIMQVFHCYTRQPAYAF
jgi:hypothetical protein